jgi:L-rhamnose-H+ transport protein
VLTFGLLFAFLSGVANGLFAVPMKLIPRWKWENIWIVFIFTACIVMPPLVVGLAPKALIATIPLLPRAAVTAALAFGFAWGFGAILFGLSVDRLGVSLANSLVIGVSSAAGSIVPLLLSGAFRVELRQMVLLGGVAIFLVGVMFCAKAGRLREAGTAVRPSWQGYLFALGSGTMSAVFNIGYSLALPIASAGQAIGLSQFRSTNLIWLLMLSAGSIPNFVFCGRLLVRNRSAKLFTAGAVSRTWGLSVLMGVLWGGSILLYGAATPLLGDLGPSVGWPVSLGVALLAATGMGYWLGEWRDADPAALRFMKLGVGSLLIALVICGTSTRLP